MCRGQVHVPKKERRRKRRIIIIIKIKIIIIIRNGAKTIVWLSHGGVLDQLRKTLSQKIDNIAILLEKGIEMAENCAVTTCLQWSIVTPTPFEALKI
jgi:hypothetical protein